MLYHLPFRDWMELDHGRRGPPAEADGPEQGEHSAAIAASPAKVAAALG